MFAYIQKKPRVNIELYIQSGIVESYTLGLATPFEKEEFEQLLPHYPELKTALSDFEYNLELFAIENEVPPPSGTRERIEARLRGIPAIRPSRSSASHGAPGSSYLHVEANSDYIRVHKLWRVAFIVVFILSKIFLALAIYYFIQYRLVAGK